MPFYLAAPARRLKRRPQRDRHPVSLPAAPDVPYAAGAATCAVRNRLTVAIQPDEGIDLSFESKVPDDGGVTLRPADMRYRYRDAYPDAPLPEAYERLIQDAIAGDAHLFMRSDEIERAWEIMDPIIAAVQDGAVKMEEYPVGSEGPCCGDDMLAPAGRAWLPIGRER